MKVRAIRRLATTSSAPAVLAAILLLGLPSTISAAPSKAKKDANARIRQLRATAREKTTRMSDKYCEDLEKAARWAIENGLASDARKIVREIGRQCPDYVPLRELRGAAKRTPKPEEGTDLAALKRPLDKKHETASRKHRKRLLDASTQCFRVGLFSRSYRFMLEVLEVDPDARDGPQKKAGKAFGYVWDGDQKKWITTWEKTQRKKHFLTKEGWFLKKDKKKFDEGLRPFLGKWMPKKREKRARSRNASNPYVVESQHFRLETAHSREMAWSILTLLEDFRRAFDRDFIGYYDPVAAARPVFKTPPLEKKHVIHLFRSKEDYLSFVQREKGNKKSLRENLGFYSPSERILRFYLPKQEKLSLAPVFHRIARQLLAETKETNLRGSVGNSWVVAGILMYNTTWAKKGKHWRPRNFEAITAAADFRKSALDWELREFIDLQPNQFHGENRRTNYSVAGAFVHFLLNYDDGIYGDDFVRFLSSYYGGTAKGETFVNNLDVPEATSSEEKVAILQTQFRSYLQKIKAKPKSKAKKKSKSKRKKRK